jgi:hypothetical protein
MTVLNLKKAPRGKIRQQFSVVMERTVAELNGESCIELEEVAPPKQQIMSSRSFGVPVFELAELQQSVASYTARAAVKLRNQASLAGAVQVYIRTSPFKDKGTPVQPGSNGSPCLPHERFTDARRSSTGRLKTDFSTRFCLCQVRNHADESDPGRPPRTDAL